MPLQHIFLPYSVSLFLLSILCIYYFCSLVPLEIFSESLEFDKKDSEIFFFLSYRRENRLQL